MPKEEEGEVLDREEQVVEGGEEETEKANDDAGEEEGELTVQIGDDAPDAEEDVSKAPQWVRDLRQAKREADRRIKELEAKVSGDKPKLGAKPTLAECDYDNDEYERRFDEWKEQERQHKAAEAEAEKAKEAADKRWQDKLQAVNDAKATLGVKDFDEAEETAKDALSAPFPGLQAEDIRMNIIKQGAKNAALVIYALGKNTKRAEELAKIEDPVEFAMAVGRMEAELKVTRKPATQPEQDSVRGAGTGAGSVDKTLDKLREKAAATGDYSEVVAYKKRKRAA